MRGDGHVNGLRQHGDRRLLGICLMPRLEIVRGCIVRGCQFEPQSFLVNERAVEPYLGAVVGRRDVETGTLNEVERDLSGIDKRKKAQLVASQRGLNIISPRAQLHA